MQKRIRAAGSKRPATQASAEESEQTACPVMGNEIDPEVYTDYGGVRIYFCCPPCIPKFEADPEQYIPKLPQVIQERIASATAQEAEGD
jgi:YHS domain-containing protein